MKLNGRVAFITGGARIGAVVAEKLAKLGCHVALSYRSSKKAILETTKNLEALDVKTLAVKADVTKESDVKSSIAKIIRTFSTLDVIVNMASIYGETPFDDISDQIWEDNINSNLKSAYLTVKYAAPYLKKNGGRVINFSDWLAASGRPRYKNYLPYVTAKAGLIGLTQAQALELAPNVLVNAIAPGPILAPEGLSKHDIQNVIKATPLARWGGPEEIAKAVIFLCETDFVTGETLRVDGGRHLY